MQLPTVWIVADQRAEETEMFFTSLLRAGEREKITNADLPRGVTPPGFNELQTEGA